jgi:hypothetical protein
MFLNIRSFVYVLIKDPIIDYILKKLDYLKNKHTMSTVNWNSKSLQSRDFAFRRSKH